MKPDRREHWNDLIFLLPSFFDQYGARKVWVPPVTGSSLVPAQGQK